MERNELPVNYVPYEELDICTNKLINGKIPIEIDGHIPFLVGRGDIPQVWLSVPGPNGDWINLVIANRIVDVESRTSKQFLLTIQESIQNRSIDMLIWKINVLSVMQETENSARITNLDFRPFNLLIFGGKEGLHIGGQLLRGNTMKNVHTMIGIGQ